MKTKNKILIILFILFSTNVFSQIPKGQINSRINLSIAPGVEVTKVATDYNLVTSINANLIFNNKFYLGGYVSKKIIQILHTDFLEGQINDISFQHAGIFLGSSIVNIKKKNSYVLRKTKVRFTYGIRIGGGAAWLNDDSWNKVTARDYFYIVQPSVGIFRPLGTFVFLTARTYFQAIYGLNTLGSLTDDDFLSPGVSVTLHITAFK